MTVVRLTGKKFSSLKSSIKHIVANEKEKVLRVIPVMKYSSDMDIKFKMLETLKKEITREYISYKEKEGEEAEAKKKELIEALANWIKLAETDLSSKKIRKNASFKEIVIAYEDDSKEKEEIIEDFKRFLNAFYSEYGFYPIGVLAIHEHEGRKHLHFIFSTRDLMKGKKVELKREKWFHVLEKYLGRDVYVEKILKRAKKIGNIPLKWIKHMQQVLIAKFNVEPSEAEKLAKEFVRSCRKLNIPKKDIRGYIKALANGEAESLEVVKAIVEKAKALEESRKELLGEIRTATRRKRRKM